MDYHQVAHIFATIVWLPVHKEHVIWRAKKTGGAALLTFDLHPPVHSLSLGTIAEKLLEVHR